MTDAHALLRDEHDYLHAVARALCRGRLDPADLVQETFARTLARLDRLPATVNLRAWMTRVMKNLFVDEVRKVRTRERYDPMPASTTDDQPWWLGLDSGDVRAALPALPAELRDTFERFAFAGESYAEIADALGIPKQTVGTRLLRARRQLKDLLANRR